MLVCGSLAIVDVEIWIPAILMLASYEDETTIGKFCACATQTVKAPYRSARLCTRVFWVSESPSSTPRSNSEWGNLVQPKRVAHKRWIGYSAYISASICEILIASDLEQVASNGSTVAVGHFRDLHSGGEHKEVSFSNGT